jgi:diguanylate cyclase (GGDEF)-like protein
VSLRARLALVLAGVMIGPAIAAWAVLGVLVPRAAARSDAQSLSRADAAVGVYLTQQCRLLAQTARAVAGPLSGRVGVDAQVARRAVAGVDTAGPDGVRAMVVAGGVPVAASPGGGGASGVAPLDLARATCAAPLEGPALLVESAPITDSSGREVARAAAYTALDGSALTRLRAALALDARLAVVRRVVAPVPLDGATAARRSGLHVVASSAGPDGAALPDGASTDALLVAAERSALGSAGGWRYRLHVAPSALPYDLLVLLPDASPGPATLPLVLALACMAALAGLLTVLAARLTRPLAALTYTAQRLGDGDLSARTRVSGDDEIGVLGSAMDAMAERLERTVAEVEQRREALAETFAQFGEALANTHNLDALLRTVVETARQGADAAVGTVLLGDGAGLAERVSIAPDGADGAWVAGVLERLTGLAARAADAGEARPADLAPAAGSALAVPMCRGEEMYGVLAVARRRGQPPLDEAAIAVVISLAVHAGTAVANVQEHLDAQRLSVTDPLTGAGNMRHLTSTLAREVERAHRFGRTLSVLMLDLDHFKQVNDWGGHAFGDAVLRDFAHRLRGCLREVDLVARRGGEEFAVVLPETGTAGAEAVVRRVMQRMRAEPFRSGAQERPVTVSIGIATYPDHGTSASEVLHAADIALYAAKRTGRDRWCRASAAPTPAGDPTRSGSRPA